jgi:hypothetical protein
VHDNLHKRLRIFLFLQGTFEDFLVVIEILLFLFYLSHDRIAFGMVQTNHNIRRMVYFSYKNRTNPGELSSASVEYSFCPLESLTIFYELNNFGLFWHYESFVSLILPALAPALPLAYTHPHHSLVGEAVHAGHVVVVAPLD